MAGSSSSARLILAVGPAVERIYRLTAGGNVIGRGKTNEIFVLDKSLSRRHARISLEGERARIEDLDSKNGTFVDGRRITVPRTLGPAHEIRCGDVRFRYEQGVSPTARVEPTLTFDVAHSTLGRAVQQLVARPAGTAPTALAATVPSPQRWQQHLELLLAATELLSEPAPLEALLDRVLALCHQLLDIDWAVVLRPTGEALQVAAARDRAGGEAQPGFSRHIAAWVAAHGRAALFERPADDPRLGDGATIAAQGIAAAMAAPLLARGRQHGVLYVDRRLPGGRLHHEELELVAAFARQAAIAIDNAELSARLAEQAVQRNNLMRFFPPQVSAAVLATGGALEPVETPACVLFCDLCGFTALCSRLSPRQVIALLNGYFPPLAEIVFAHRGTVEKYIGDALLAVWGAPFAAEDDAELAVDAAIAMHRAVERMDAIGVMGTTGTAPALAVHIGIGCGVVAAGNVGSERYLQYATVGDVTNRAARICGVATAGQVVVDAELAARLPDRYPTRSLGPVRLQGKAEPAELYEICRR